MFFRCAASVQHPCAHARLLDFVSDEFSRITVVLQYYAQLLRGRGERLRLLWEAANQLLIGFRVRASEFSWSCRCVCSLAPSRWCTHISNCWLKAAGCQSYESWFEKHRDHALKFVTAVSLAMCWVWRRHAVLFASWPWKLASLSDNRLTRVQRARIARDAMNTPLCCADPYFLRRIYNIT